MLCYVMFHKTFYNSGGWLLVAHYKITDGLFKDISSNMTTHIFDVRHNNYERYLSSPAGLTALHSYMGYSQMRFYCYMDGPGRVVHFRTREINIAHEMLRYMRREHESAPTACNTFRSYQDDSSKSGNKCGSWSSSPKNVWGHPSYRQEMMYQYAFGVYPEYTWHFGFNSILRCDSGENDRLWKFGIWKVFVR